MSTSRALIAVAAAATAVAAAQTAPARSAAAPHLTVAGWQAERGGTAIWDGGAARLEEVRFLRGARLASLSPSGAAVAYIRYAGNGFDVLHTGVYAGYEATLVHVSGSHTTALAVSPDSRTVAFASPRGIELASIVPGKGRHTLALPARWRGSTYAGLRFSPDGLRLAFSRTWGDGRAGTLRNELAIAGLDGSGARSLVRNPDPYGAQYRPSFSPDGLRLAFTAADGSLGVVPATGGTVERLTDPRPARSLRTDAGPLFSPDGETIAFTRAPTGGGSDVYLVGADGSGLRRLTTTPLPARGVPRIGTSALAWSPDGTTVLAFRHDRFARVDAATGASTDLARVGVQYELTAARWG